MQISRCTSKQILYTRADYAWGKIDVYQPRNVVYRFECVTVIDINVQSGAQGRTTLLSRREWMEGVYILYAADVFSMSSPPTRGSGYTGYVDNDLTAQRDARDMNHGLMRNSINSVYSYALSSACLRCRLAEKYQYALARVPEASITDLRH